MKDENVRKEFNVWLPLVVDDGESIHCRFLQLMRDKNMPIWAISTGNEPLNAVIGWIFVHFMSLGWRAETQVFPKFSQISSKNCNVTFFRGGRRGCVWKSAIDRFSMDWGGVMENYSRRKSGLFLGHFPQWTFGSKITQFRDWEEGPDPGQWWPTLLLSTLVWSGKCFWWYLFQIHEDEDESTPLFIAKEIHIKKDLIFNNFT